MIIFIIFALLLPNENLKDIPPLPNCNILLHQEKPLGEFFTMEQVCCIYKITSPSGNIYIGQTRNYANRIKKYRLLHCKGQPKLYSSFLKYGFDKHVIEIIHTCNEYQLNELEIFYIKKFNTFDTEKGLNLSIGGHLRVLSKESIDKIKIATKNHVLIHGNYCKGKACSDESRKKMSISRKAYIEKHGNYKINPITEEKREKLRLSHLGKKASPESKLKVSESLKRRYAEKRRLSESQNQLKIFI